jgi:Asp-tRNA(Asn)/Glu-tRNA(Gln) amidotransferase A subunit family amidase
LIEEFVKSWMHGGKRSNRSAAIVEEAEPNFEGADEAFRTLRALGFHQQHAAKVAQYRDQIKATVPEEVDLGAKLTSAQINEADALRSALYERVGEFFGKYEFFVLPVTQVPVRHQPALRGGNRRPQNGQLY